MNKTIDEQREAIIKALIDETTPAIPGRLFHLSESEKVKRANSKLKSQIEIEKWEDAKAFGYENY